MEIQSVVIVGAGLIGKGLAQVYSNCEGLEVTLYDLKDTSPLSAIRENLNQLADREILTRAQVDERMKRISFTTDFNHPCFARADLVAESVFEDMRLKQDTFARLESRCRQDAIFATNTSVMSPTEISARLVHKERLVGTHFWNPAHLIPLVEVVKSGYTSDEVAETTLKLLERAGKVPVLCKKDVPGFIANRMQHALWREAISILENDIADAETIDKAVRYSFGLRLPQLGPLENLDMVGADLIYNIHDYLLPHLENSPKPSPVLVKLNEGGKLGFKAGEGLRKWTPEQIEKSRRELNEYLIKMIYDQ
ncbi:MAG: 3-hydroxyacyl-CoA dehydrogenase family protein [Oscillospiraceae bacterium]|nr:3-hydroxyacyl-CoA dehydrogenase family protein [Oscillospiraceae bacterium]